MWERSSNRLVTCSERCEEPGELLNVLFLPSLLLLLLLLSFRVAGLVLVSFGWFRSASSDRTSTSVDATNIAQLPKFSAALGMRNAAVGILWLTIERTMVPTTKMAEEIR